MLLDILAPRLDHYTPKSQITGVSGNGALEGSKFRGNVGALIIRIGFRGPLHNTYNKEQYR